MKSEAQIIVAVLDHLHGKIMNTAGKPKDDASERFYNCLLKRYLLDLEKHWGM